MSVVAVVIVVVVAIFAASMLGAWLRGGNTGGAAATDVNAVREDMQRLLTAQAQGFAGQMGQLTQLVTQHLTEMRQQLDDSVSSTGRITVDAQREMSQQLRESNEALAKLQQHLGQAQNSGRELTQAAQAMQAVLGGSKPLGQLGEAALPGLLSDVLPGSAYELDHKFTTGGEAAVLHTGHKLIAIDTGFPLDSYRQFVEKGEPAHAAFADAVRKHVDEVAAQCIAPAEGTLDMALMFVPSESAFHEVLATADSKGRLEDYLRQQNVLAVSPNSLHAYLATILVGLKGMEFEENARQMLGELDDVKKEIDEFTQLHIDLGQQLHQARQIHDDAGQRLVSARNLLDKVSENASGNGASISGAETAETEFVPVPASNNGA